MQKVTYLLLFVLLQTVAMAQKPLLLDNFTLIDGTGGSSREGVSLLILGDTIHSVFDYGDTVEFSEVEKLDLTGKYLLPGLFDAHTHLASDPSGRDQWQVVLERLDLLLRSGVTGVRDMSGDARLLSYLSRQAALDEIMSPDIYFSGLVAGERFFQRDRRVARASSGYARGEAPWMRAIGLNTDLRQVISEVKGTGATGLKLYSNLSGTQVGDITSEAKRQGLKVWAHAAILPGIPSDMVKGGVEVLSHGMLLALEQLVKPVPGQRPRIDTALTDSSDKLEALSALMAKEGTVLDPTLTVNRGRRPRALYANGVKATRIAYKAGVTIVIGTDRGIPVEGDNTLPLIEEMEAMVKDVGIPVNEVIRMATLNTAAILGLNKIAGSVEPGKKANLLIVDLNPADDIRNLEQVYLVIKNGNRIN